ncbi:hypothetical protein TNCV_3832051 [Trichonephila clavipes]|nr:hypothetical protein TNCV_3832051 [Trichonephila clavipes]
MKVFIIVGQKSNTKAIDEGLRNFERWSNEEGDTLSRHSLSELPLYLIMNTLKLDRNHPSTPTRRVFSGTGTRTHDTP